jgi:hypothetical protein
MKTYQYSLSNGDTLDILSPFDALGGKASITYTPAGRNDGRGMLKIFAEAFLHSHNYQGVALKELKENTSSVLEISYQPALKARRQFDFDEMVESMARELQKKLEQMQQEGAQLHGDHAEKTSRNRTSPKRGLD